mmetsp:Transcript_79278/g.149582  ORF Transcript_79278/g.149582 Transcript_79278/m.149582 type:complete len:127 (+) Transcript_79278:4013-4393(+)
MPWCFFIQIWVSVHAPASLREGCQRGLEIRVFLAQQISKVSEEDSDVSFEHVGLWVGTFRHGKMSNSFSIDTCKTQSTYHFRTFMLLYASWTCAFAALCSAAIGSLQGQSMSRCCQVHGLEGSGMC